MSSKFNLTPFSSILSYIYMCGSNTDPDPQHWEPVLGACFKVLCKLKKIFVMPLYHLQPEQAPGADLKGTGPAILTSINPHQSSSLDGFMWAAGIEPRFRGYGPVGLPQSSILQLSVCYEPDSLGSSEGSGG